MKRLLVLFAKGFPYNVSEPFLENEYPLYKKYYDKVLIITGCSKTEPPTRTVTDPTLEIIKDHTLSKDLRSIIEALPYVLTDKLFYKELKNLLFSGKCTLRKLYDLMVITLCANHRMMQALRWMKHHPEYDTDVIYSYWMQITAYAAIRLNEKLGNKCHTVSRVHRFDLYSEYSTTGYLPFNQQIFERLDEVASISDDGKQYLENKYGATDKITIHHLGALDRGLHNPSAPRDPFRIVSCARTVPIKRLDRIVDALSQITDRKILWTHLGGGQTLEYLKQYAAEKLPANVSVQFSGTIPNTQVYETYHNQPFHVFINVSESEGVPVSIMEAMSFDIPIIATAVGGTPELIDEGKNGFLLPQYFSDEDLISRIKQLMQVSDEEYLLVRKNSREKFEQDYNAIPNYRKFVETLADRSKKS